MSDPFPYRDHFGVPTDPLGWPLDPETRRRVWAAHNERELGRLNREYGVIESIEELRGWDIKELRRYKDGVVCYRAQRSYGTQTEERNGFAKDEVFAHLQIRP